MVAGAGTKVSVQAESAANTGKSCWTNTSKDIIDTGTAAGIYALRRLKIKHCAELVGAARSVLDFCSPISQNIHEPNFLIEILCREWFQIPSNQKMRL